MADPVFVRMSRPGMVGVMEVAPHNVDGLIGKGWVVDGSPSTPAPESKPAPNKPKPVGGAPNRNASRKVWADYAVSVGVDPSGLTRGKIQDAVDAKLGG